MFNEKFVINKTLNKKLFGEDNHLLPAVRQKLYDIVDFFIDYSDVEIPVLDAYIIGSNASFNYTPTSDIDLHIITNYELVEAPEDILSALYGFQKSMFNKEYDITINGLEVELYVKDVNNTSAVSNGVYSLYSDEWIKFPKQIRAQSYDFDYIMPLWRKRVSKVCENGTLHNAQILLNRLYMMRKESILKDGEYGKGNQLFKDIRNEGLLQDLKDRIKELEAEELSL